MASLAVGDSLQAPFLVRNVKKTDIPGVMKVLIESGMMEGSQIIHTWLALEPDGFFVAVHLETGEILGTCGGVIHRNDLGFLGLYAVLEQYRRHGIGGRLFGAVMNHLGDRNVVLNAVLERLPTYRDLAGFKVVSPWASTVYKGAKLTPENLVSEVDDVKILPYNADMLDKIVEFDAIVYGYKRDRILKIDLQEEASFVVVALRESSGVVCGFGKAKENIQGAALLGPVYAENPKIAELIYRRLAEDYPLAREEGISLVSITANPESMIVAEKLGLTLQAVLPRCHTRKAVEAADYRKLFALQSLSFTVF